MNTAPRMHYFPESDDRVQTERLIVGGFKARTCNKLNYTITGYGLTRYGAIADLNEKIEAHERLCEEYSR